MDPSEHSPEIPPQRSPEIPIIPAETLLQAYKDGRFPMAHEDGELYWHDPDPRAIFPLDQLVPDPRTARHLRSKKISITIDSAFETVIRACSQRAESWIDERIIRSYVALHERGYAHSLEVWRDGELAGGIYGVAIGAAFFGESMFSTRNNMGKAAFHALVHHLRSKGYRLFDTQYINEFTQQLGAIEIPREDYQRTLRAALAFSIEFK